MRHLAIESSQIRAVGSEMGHHLEKYRTPKYVLVTAAKNEEEYIRGALESVIRQTILPLRWVIVSDGSTDGTNEIVAGYQKDNNYIELLVPGQAKRRSFASQAQALNLGISHLAEQDFCYLGLLDADIVLKDGYYAEVIRRFQDDPALGICGGFVYERIGAQYTPRRSNSIDSVPGGVQMFSADCLKGIRQFRPLKYGGLDTYASYLAQQQGFRVRALPDLPVFHQRRTGGGQPTLSAAYRSGRMDREIGYHLVYEILACARRATLRPYLASGSAKMLGYLAGLVSGQPPAPDRVLLRFIRRSQLRAIVKKVHYERKHRASRIRIARLPAWMKYV